MANQSEFKKEELIARLLAEIKNTRGIVAVTIFDADDIDKLLEIEQEAEAKSLLGLGKVVNTGIQKIVQCSLIFVALTSMDFDWALHGALILKKGNEIVGEEIRDPERLKNLQGRADVWFLHRNFVIYKDRLSFPRDIMQKICHFEIPPIPCHWPGITFLPAGSNLLLANPSTPADIFLKNKYFQGQDEKGLGTILLGVSAIEPSLWQNNRRSSVAVNQEMAEIYPPRSEDLAEYLPASDCGRCGFASCEAFAAALLTKTSQPQQCPELEPELVDLMTAVLALDTSPIPFNVMMEQHPCEVLEINQPDERSPVLVTANFVETVAIMTKILTQTNSRSFLLPTFTHGYSVDNAVHERMFKAVEVLKAMKENYLEQRLIKPLIIIPGLAENEKLAIRQLTKCEVLVGPISGFLAPLFLYTLL